MKKNYRFQLIDLKMLLYYIEKKEKEILAEMMNPDHEFLFACISINLTFYLKKYFHLADFLDYYKDKQQFSSRFALKNFV